MASRLNGVTGSRLLARALPATLRAHPFLVAAAAAVLIGGGLRFVPASTAALPGSSASGPGGASTACAAQ
jgi:hypothetical protein